MQQGWGADYQKEVGVDPGAKSVSREDMNELFYIVTALLNRWQTETFPEWIDPASNAGSPYAYPKGAVVRYSADGSPPFVAWMNTIDDNATEPSAPNNWILFESLLLLATDPTETTRGAPYLATEVQATTGTDNKSMMSALRVVQLIRGAAASASESLRGVLKVGTQAEVNAGTSDSVAVTPKKLLNGYFSSFLENWRISFPSWLGGWIIQGGLAAAPASGMNTTITFPLTFPDSVKGIHLTAFSGSIVQINGSTITSYTTSGAIVDSNRNVGTKTQLFWLAIGN